MTSAERAPESASTDESFYASLEPLRQFEDIFDMDRYVACPPDWYLVVADVRGSTKAIESGRYKQVNVLGVATITGLVNVCDGVELPYVFGGDGATVALPSDKLPAARRALSELARIARDRFELELSVGAVRVGELTREGHEVKVAKYALSDAVSLAMFAGTGVAAAEARVKDRSSADRFELGDEPGQGDFTGLECRWQPLESRNGVVLSLLVLPVGDQPSAICLDVWRTVSRLGELGSLRPVGEDNAQLATEEAAFVAEAAVRSGAGADDETLRRYRKKARRLTRIGAWLTRFGLNLGGFDGRHYLQRTVLNSDFRKFDGTLRLILDVSAEQKATLLDYLERERQAGRLVYGVVEQTAALMTCMVQDYKERHVHFVDGAEGGYALAAKQLKAQLSSHSDSSGAPSRNAPSASR